MDSYIIAVENKVKYGPSRWNARAFTNVVAALGAGGVSFSTAPPVIVVDIGNGIMIKNIGPKPDFNRQTQNCTCGLNGFTVSDKPRKEIDKAFLKAKAKAIDKVNQLAEEARQKLITQGAGQAQEYASVQKEVARLQASGKVPVKSGDYPFLEAGIGSEVKGTGFLGNDIREAARLAESAIEKWNAVGPLIRKNRLDKLAAIKSAKTFEELATI